MAEKRPSKPKEERRPSKSKTRSPKRGTLGWLAKESWKGPEAVARALGQFTYGAGELDPYALISAGAGRRAVRSDLKEGDESILYYDCSPPSLWAPGFAVLRVDVSSREPDYMFHSGEELLFTLTGSVRYTFVQAVAGTVTKRDARVAEDEAIRVNPQLPHSASAEDGPSHCWMILRYPTDHPKRIVDPGTGLYASYDHPPPRRVKPSKLKDPAIYAATAWGLSEMIRVYRQRADLTIDQLSKACGVDAALLSRLEAAQRKPETPGINVAVEALLRVAAYLSIPLPRLIWQALQEPFQKASIKYAVDPETGISARPILGSAAIAHELHVAVIDILAGRQAAAPSSCEFTKGTLACWIVMKGALTVTIASDNLFGIDNQPALPSSVTLSEGSVLHFRTAVPKSVLAHSDTQIIQIVHSTECRCAPSPVSP